MNTNAIKVERFDARALRVCCETPWKFKAEAASVPGARWEKAWRGVSGNAIERKVWHWPVQSMPTLLRRFPDAWTDDRAMQSVIDRAAEINAARAATINVARNAGGDITLRTMQPRASGLVLYEHQIAAVRRTLLDGGSRALYHQTGTGKTLTAATLLDELVRPVDGMRVGVVVCPVTLVTAAWMPDLARWFPDLPVVNLRQHKKGEAREYAVQQMVNQRGRCIALVNYETVRSDPSVRRIMSGAMVVCDESSKLKSDTAEVTNVMRTIAPTFRAIVLLSGTPAPNSPIEYYPQAKLIAAVTDVDPFPGTKTAYRTEFCAPGTFGGFTFRRDKIEVMRERLATTSEWLLKSSCIDLPEKKFIDVPVELEKDTARHYVTMRDLMEMTIRNQYGRELRSHATNALSKVMRLRQITAGFIPAVPETWASGDDEALNGAGQMMVPLGTEKLDWLAEFAENAGERVLVWTQFKFELVRAMKYLTDRKVKCDFIDGSVKDSDRAPKIEAFKRSDVQVLFAHPKTMQYGVSLPGVSLSVFLSCSRSCEEYLQAQDRIHGIGRGDATKHSTFYRLLATVDGDESYDHDIQTCLDGKEALQSLVFRLARDAEGVRT